MLGINSSGKAGEWEYLGITWNPERSCRALLWQRERRKEKLSSLSENLKSVLQTLLGREQFPPSSAITAYSRCVFPARSSWGQHSESTVAPEQDPAELQDPPVSPLLKMQWNLWPITQNTPSFWLNYFKCESHKQIYSLQPFSYNSWS